ncbi:HEAT repeat domain-containing protein [Mesoterricola silvestris]|uniref:HEAT repeat protein n=1 Tax=Mesoterricola silvestris TaxID=2927979 RepID=A0AA48GRE2_9BACT|nr:HEAT repeat domain-containing protein [Mesoterricola silvestris]BDU72632.1 hypothetical protein METEAL_18060 [Mesoterricola silvestris]
MSDFQELLQTLQMALKTRLMYTAAHPRAKGSMEALTMLIEDWLQDRPTLHVATSGGRMFVDGQPFEGQGIHLTNTGKLLSERQISGIIFSRGIETWEVEELLDLLILKPSRIEELGGAGRIIGDKNLQHIEMGQVQYREVREGEAGSAPDAGPAMRPVTLPAGAQLPVEPAPRTPPAPTLDALQAMIDQWRQEFQKLHGIKAAAMGWQGTGAPGPGPGMPGFGGPGLGAPGFGGPGTAEFGSGGPGPGGIGPGGPGTDGPEHPGPEAGPGGPGPDLAADLDALGKGPMDLSFLAGTLSAVGFGEGFPTAQQMEGLRTALRELPPGTLLSMVAGLDTLPHSPAGLRMAFQALAPEIFGHATASMLAQGAGQGDTWDALKDHLHAILQGSPSFQGLLAALENELRNRGLGLENLHDLVSRMDWETMGIDEQLRLVAEHDHLWKLSHDQRLRFLRKLLDEGRLDTFGTILEEVVRNLTSDDAHRREMAARTLGGVVHWLAVPGIPPECELSLLHGLTAHFGSERLPRTHHITTEALGTALDEMVQRGEPGHAHALLLELDALVMFLASREPWRTDALAWLWERLAQPESLARVMELLHTSNPESLLNELIPYLEKVGMPAAQALVEVLGEEQDRKRRARLMEVIRGLGGLALPAVIASLESPKWFLVRNTLNLMADMGDMAALKPAEACLGHHDVRVRCAAVRTAWKVGGPVAMPALLAAFGKADPDTMLEILFAFGQIRSAAAVPTLGAFATDHRMPEKLRARAAEVLGTIGDPSALPFLEELVRRKGRIFTTAEPTEIRVAACRSLAALGTPVALGSLRALVAKEPRNSDRPLLQQVLEQSLR